MPGVTDVAGALPTVDGLDPGGGNLSGIDAGHACQKNQHGKDGVWTDVVGDQSD